MGWIIFLAVVSLIIFAVTRKLPPDNYSNWNHLIDGMKFSTKDFYDRLEESLKSQLMEEAEEVFLSRVQLSEQGIFSSKREYLRIQWREFTHDIGAFPFAGGFYITSWQYKEITGLEALIKRIPLFGTAIHLFFYPVTYYTIDTASMYLTYVQHSLMTMVDTLTKDQGLRALSEAERKPQMENIFKRK